MSNDGTATGAENPGTPTPGGSPDQEAAKFTQAHIDAIVEKKTQQHARVLKRDVDAAKAAGVAGILEELELDSIDDLREKFTAQGANATEAETQAKAHKKALRQIEDLTKRADAAEKANAQQTARGNAATLRTTVYDAAKAAGGFEKAVYAELKTDGLIGNDEDGKPIVLNADSGEPEHGVTIEQLVVQFVADNPNHRRATPGRGGGSQPAAGAAGNNQPEHAPGSYEAWGELIKSDPRFAGYGGGGSGS